MSKSILESARVQITQKVKEISLVTPGGEKFFDALDKEIIESSSDEMILALFSLVPSGYRLVLSGGFGRKISESIDSGRLPRISYELFEGGIRKGGEVKPIRSRVCGERTCSSRIFLDDSIYGGKTFYMIQHFYESQQIPLRLCAVIYDGCPVEKPYVKSLYRYYDFHNVKPNFKF
jgi:hypothetical protein